VSTFSEADELDAKVIQFIQDFQEMPHASGHSVERGDEHDIEAASRSIGHELI
jgi:hypothetical protein